jgi:hypothetical protein
MIQCAEPVQLTLRDEELSDFRFQLILGLERKLKCLLQLEVRIHICDDLIQMFGVTESYYLKQQAQELVREFAPKFRIQNDMLVLPAGSLIQHV